MTTFPLVQRTVTNRQMSVREIAAIRGQAFKVAHSEGIDVVILVEDARVRFHVQGIRKLETEHVRH